MSATLKYNLSQFHDIANNGFHYEIPKETCDIINRLCKQVKSAELASVIFTKKHDTSSLSPAIVLDSAPKKRRGNKAMEVTGDDWETLRTFQPTKMEVKVGIDAELNEIRLLLNKITDKTYLDIREKLIAKINTIGEEHIPRLAETLYESCSTNKFYSKIFADMFAELSSQYKWLHDLFLVKQEAIMSIYTNIRYVDSDKDYDGFCEMNKENEKRRAITTFYTNLSLNGFIEKRFIVRLLNDILNTIRSLIEIADKKNEVDELTEVVSLLYDKDMIDVEEDGFSIVNDNNIMDTITHLAQSKPKDYVSLSNKSIFKFMDLIEM